MSVLGEGGKEEGDEECCMEVLDQAEYDTGVQLKLLLLMNYDSFIHNKKVIYGY